jgi:energy-coupling factor transport system permease protein
MNEIVDSFLARRNPVVKLGVLLVLSLSLTVIFDPVTPAVFALLGLLAAWGLGGVRPLRLVRAMAPLLAAAAGIMMANLLFGREVAGDVVLGSWGPFTVTEARLMVGGSIALRVLAFAALSLSFVFTTEPGLFVLSLVQQLRFNYRVAFGVLVGYRMLPLLQSEYQHIRAAQRARGMAEGRGPVAWFQRMRRYAVPLLAGAVRRAGRVALAMDARAFGAFPERTYRRRVRVGPADWAFAVGAVGLGAAVVTVLTALGVTRFGVGV